MRRQLQKKDKKKVLLKKISRAFIFIFLIYICIRIGIVSGNYLAKNEVRAIGEIEVEFFRKTVNNSLPIINIVFNSGNISVSVSDEIRAAMKTIFNFELGKPITLINSQSSIFYSYFLGNYDRLLAEGFNIDNPKDSTETTTIHNERRFNEIVSSISYEDESDARIYDDMDTVTYEKINIINETNYNIDVDELLKEPLNINFAKRGAEVLIYHTHNTEGYLRNISQLRDFSIPNTTSDERFNVLRVGRELADNLRRNSEIEVIHNATNHVFPSYNGSYGRSLNTVSNILRSYPSIKMVFDIHRDAISHNEKFRPVAKIGDKDVAKIMFVVGTDSTGLSHPNWRENLKLAMDLQKRLNRIAPGITRPIYISRHRYNQHLHNNSLIIEVGGDGNLIDEALESIKYLSQAIDELIKENK